MHHVAIITFLIPPTAHAISYCRSISNDNIHTLQASLVLVISAYLSIHENNVELKVLSTEHMT